MKGEFVVGHPQPPLIKKIQNYIFRFSDLIGQGNFSKVYKAHNELTNEIVAIKIVQLESLKSKKLEELLFSEIDVLKKLNHPNILRCFEVFTSNRNCYIITELCNEGDLQSRLRKERYFDEASVQPILKDIFEGLLYLAEKEVIHRDLKVANVFINNGKAKLADFGFAKFTREKFKDINIGSPIYMSPEGFIHNIYGPKTDVWALGVMLYELVHGETPFACCKTESELKYHLSIPISKNRIKSTLSADLRQVIYRCMEVDENKRISVKQLSQTPYFMRVTGRYLNMGLHAPIDIRVKMPENNLALSNPNSIRKTSSDRRPQMASQNHLKLQNHLVSRSPSTIMPYSDFSSELTKDKRGTSTQNNLCRTENNSEKLTPAPIYQMPQPQSSPPRKDKSKVFSFRLLFKECVNILHYCRLIFKFILTLKLSQYCKDNELAKLSKWLIEVLMEIEQKINDGSIQYDGQNAAIREQKLKQVRSEYEKKYRKELAEYLRNQPQFLQNQYTLEFIKDYLFTLFQKYDALIYKDRKTTLLALGHSIIVIYDTTKMLKKCYEDKNYSVFLTSKNVETLLALPKEAIDFASYENYRFRMMVDA